MNTLILVYLFVLLSCTHAQNKTGDGWKWYCVGMCNQDTITTPSPGVVLMGGGVDVDAAFKWMIKKSGGGNFVVLRTSGADGYNSYIYDMRGIASVATIVMSSKKASSDPFVLSQIKNAEAIWFAGGDQAAYMTYWNSTLVQSTLQALLVKGTPIGGTSAGMAVLPEFVFTAMNGGVTSAEALQNPYNQYMTFGDKFLDIPLLYNVITDMHFVQRDRMGRSLAFLSRLIQDGWTQGSPTVRAVCADEQSAVLLDIESGIGTITSPIAASVYFLQTTTAPTVCSPKVSLSINNVKVHRTRSGDTFNFNKWHGLSGGVNYTLTVSKGVISSSSGSIY